MTEDVQREKKLKTLPAVRVDEDLYDAVIAEVMRVSDSSVAYVIRQALRMYFETHGRIVHHAEGPDK